MVKNVVNKIPVRHEICVLGITMPPKIKRRGRPRGHDLTTIGLPAKKTKRSLKKKPRSFKLLHTSEKEKSKLKVSVIV